MAEIYKIAESWMGVWVRSGPGINYAQVGVIYGRDNKEYEVIERQNTYWLNIPSVGGWCCDRDSNDVMVLNKTGTTSATPVTPEPEKPIEEVDEETYAFVPDIDIITSTEQQYVNDLSNNFTVSNIRGIFGMPYQFMPSADPRLSDSDDSIGRKFAKEVADALPLLLITPGVPRFMGTYGKNDRAKVLTQYVGLAADTISQITDSVFSPKSGKYYTLEYAYTDYFNYVNPMCRIAARMLNLHGEVVDGEKLDSKNWSGSVNDNFNKLFSVYKGCTAWYCDSDTSISDNWSNGTTQSMMADKINSLSDYGRELNFILGTAKATSGIGTALDKFTGQNDLASNIENVNSFITGALGTNGVSGLFKTITNSVQTVVAGGKLVFPEIWADSQFSRSYDIKLKLVSPDGDDLSIYLNIIVPILHLMGLVLPREAGKTGHGYISPFLVRGFYKGLFNVDMGIITDLSITKGKESAWNINGIPLTVDVSLTIKDLYNDIYMTNMKDLTHDTMNNIILMDYIGNLCGININEPDIYRSIDLFFIQRGVNRVKDTWRMKVFGTLDQWITNTYQSIFGRF